MITNTTIGRYGRFGNMLFQVAAIIGIARRTGHEFGFEPLVNHDHRDRFGSLEDVDLQKYFVHPLPEFINDRQLTPIDFQWGYNDLSYFSHDVNWDLHGHFQSEKYFKHAIEEVRHYLTMKDEVDMSDHVAIHVRRGDYDNHYHTILDGNYYRQAIEQFPKGTKFVLFTDAIPAASAMLAGMADFMSICNTGSYITDWRVMKRCGGFICANSSYSLMAAILSEAPNKKIVCPSNWFGPAWNPETKDLYPEGAIVI